MNLDTAPIETKSMARQIADVLREAIIDGRLQADDRLPTEEELAARYGVSRPTIREALKRLTAQNLIRSRRGPKGGTFVNRLSHGDLADSLGTGMMLMVAMGEVNLEQVAEARRELELLCCGLAVERRTQDQIKGMADEIGIQADPMTTDEQFCASDVRFHQYLAEATDNPVLHLSMSGVIGALQPATNLVIYRQRSRDDVVEQHRALLKALEAGDGEAAREAITRQMDALVVSYQQEQARRDRLI